MIENYLKVSFRNLRRHKSYTAINILGLGVGLATCLLIFLWVHDEWKYDRFHVQADRIYNVMINQTDPDGSINTHWATPARLTETLEQEVAEVDLIAQTSMDVELLIKFKDNAFQLNGLYGDSNLFKIFSFPIVKGNKENPINNKNTVAISASLATKLFADQEPIGKTIQVNQSHELMVSSVFSDIPSNSSLQFDFVIPIDIFREENPWTQNWQSGGTRTYLSLHQGADLTDANQNLSSLIKKNCPDCNSSPFLFPFTQSHLYTGFEDGRASGGRIDQVYLFSAIGVIVLIMACINFMNLATARSSTRSREVGVRKVIGAKRSGLVIQFLVESVILSFLSLSIAILLVSLIISDFNDLTGKNITFEHIDPVLVGGVFLLTLACGLMAGSYPAIFLSSFKPAAGLRGDTGSGLTGSGLRKTLVVFQLAASLTMIIGSAAVYRQIEFINNKNLGYDKENIIIIDPQKGILQNSEPFKNDLQKFPGIGSAGFSGSDILSVPITANDIAWPGKSESSTPSFKILRCDHDFLQTLGIDLIAGRNFTPDETSENPHYIINRKAMEVMGLSLEEVIGAELEAWQGMGKIIGVTADFHNNNLRKDIEPMVFMHSSDLGFHYYIKTNPGFGMEETLAHLEKTMKSYAPDYPFAYRFLDEAFEREYGMEKVMGKLSLGFTLVAVLIACLGLFGLSSFSAAKRIKEMGIRKVFGASPAQLLCLLCGDFVKLVFVGVVIGFPLAWYCAKAYLSGFAFHAEMGFWTYLFTAIGLLGIALFTVIFQALRVAGLNPAMSLRDE